MTFRPRWAERPEEARVPASVAQRPLSCNDVTDSGDRHGREAEARAARRQAHVWVAAIIIVRTNRHREGHPGRTYWSVQLEARGCNC